MRVSRSCSSKRHNSTRSATSEKTAKLVPRLSDVAPSGNGSPGRTAVLWERALESEERALESEGRALEPEAKVALLLMSARVLQGRRRTQGGSARPRTFSQRAPADFL